MGVVVPKKDVTVFSDSMLRFIVPKVFTGEVNLNGRIEVKTDHGSFTGSTLFNYNPALNGIASLTPGGAFSEDNTGTATPTTTATINQETVNSNPQTTGPNPLVVATNTKNPNGGNELLVIKVNTDPTLGVWKIEPEAKYNYIINVVEVGPNNTITTSEVTKGEYETLEGFVSQDGQTFSINRQQFIDSNSQFKREINDNSGKEIRIDTQINVMAIPADQEKYPKNTETFSNFEIVVPKSLSKTFPPKQLSITLADEEPTIQGNGPQFYNIKKPNGEYITFKFNTEDPFNSQWVGSTMFVKNGSTVPLASGCVSGSDTRYTQSCTVSQLGVIRLVIEYYPYGFTSPIGGEVLKQTVMSSPFTL